MKFLLDQDVYAVTRRFLRQLGHDVETAFATGLSTAEDSVLLAFARERGRIFVTRDRDFGGLVFVRGEGPETLKLHVFLDRSVMEVFVNDGLMSVTRVNYPPEKDLGVAAFAENGRITLKSLEIWKMNPIW